MATSMPSSRRLLSEASPSIGSKERNTDSPRNTRVTCEPRPAKMAASSTAM